MSIYQFAAWRPEIAADAYVAPGAHVMGRVRLLPRASVWFGAVLRGDNEPIEIGEESNVQDGAVLHTDPGYALRVGARVTIGHQAMLHGCIVGEGSLVGIQAVILNGAQIGRNCLVGAGALVTEGKVFPDGVLILGSPARVARELTAEAIAAMQANTQHYVERAKRFSQELHLIHP
ncbi:MAG: gamma carbonic anhydrase family protein [Burkholderiaceae bacterium]|nr:gamma carbonic anhydrase family protein [Burkholderiaceae bacterium]